MAGGWAVLGIIFFIVCKLNTKKNGSHIDVAVDDEDITSEEDRTLKMHWSC